MGGARPVTIRKLTITHDLPDTETYNGVEETGLIAGETLAFGEWVYYLNGKYYKARGNSVATMPARGIVIKAAATNADLTILTEGYIRDDTWNWLIDDDIYISGATAGAASQTAPTSDGYQVQKVGYGYSNDVIKVNIAQNVAEVQE